MVHFYHLHALDFVDVANALQADPAKAAKLAQSISPRPAKTEDFAAVQAKLKTFVESGQLGPFTNAYFLGGHPSYYLEPEANLVATTHYLEALRAQVDIAKGMIGTTGRARMAPPVAIAAETPQMEMPEARGAAHSLLNLKYLRAT